MEKEIRVILDLSDEVQALLERQGVNLYREIQQALPSIQLIKENDPDVPSGSRDIATIILASASLASALTPIIIRILNQFTPPTRSKEWIIEETETLQPDGSKIIHRKRVLSVTEQRMYPPQADQPKAVELPSSHEMKKIDE